MASYYDYVLGFIPLAMLGVTAVLFAVGVSLTAAVPVGAGASALLVGHALFVNGPTSPVASVETVDAPDAPAAASGTVVNAD
jgi:hypothetical protein